MKCTTVIDKDREEEVIIYLKEESDISKQIEEIIMNRYDGLIGYKDGEMIRLSLSEVFCFSVEDSKVLAILDCENYRMKARLYEIESMLSDAFVKINKSCIINISKIKRFKATIGGSLRVELKNGYTDYVSRRQVKLVKERLGIK